MVVPNDHWAQALHESTACLRVQRRNRRSDESSSSQLMQLLDMAMEYLSILENQLVALNNSQSERNAETWSHPPARPPPTWVQFSELYTHDKDRAIQEAFATSGAPPHYEDDDAGDIPNPYGMNGNMDCRRLHIRILTSQSEIFASKASLFAARDCKHFKEGAKQLQMGLDKIHQALQVADSQISKWWADMERTQLTNASFRTREKDALVEDANIVEVAIQNMTQRREKLLSLCQQEQIWLLRQLEPQWESRDEVKQRFGEERWTNNPRPKRDYAEMRRDLEIRLRAVRQAMEALQAMDPTMALQRANTLQYQLQHGVRPENGNVITNGESRDESKQDDEMMRERRYNGIRPTTEWLSRRVDTQQYPDPTSFGWKFTGSWQAVEFFERMVVLDEKEYSVKLDWYFTTATIKTSLDHPTQGKTQLFGKQVSPDEYKKILENPRVHTGKRYQQRRGGGRSGKRRGGRGRNRSGAKNSAQNQASAVLRPSQVSSA